MPQSLPFGEAFLLTLRIAEFALQSANQAQKRYEQMDQLTPQFLRDTPIARGPQNPPNIPKYQKYTAFTRIFSKSSRELLLSSL